MGLKPFDDKLGMRKKIGLNPVDDKLCIRKNGVESC